ncbi:hypothetical protein EG329_006913 [Mollisiaceae sp. DMI_Dod_QoI]|nr:hypothetical protein EG329_006913 [Helotiales sp. DMI_Dod_QoI]
MPAVVEQQIQAPEAMTASTSNIEVAQPPPSCQPPVTLSVCEEERKPVANAAAADALRAAAKCTPLSIEQTALGSPGHG